MADPPSPTGVGSPIVVCADEQDDVDIDAARWAALAEAVLRAEGASGELTLTFVDPSRDRVAERRAHGRRRVRPTCCRSRSMPPTPASSRRHRRSTARRCSSATSCVCPAIAAIAAPDHGGSARRRAGAAGRARHPPRARPRPRRTGRDGSDARARARACCRSTTGTGPCRRTFRAGRAGAERAVTAVAWTTIDTVMLLAIVLLLFVLMFFAVAETSLNRISRVKAQAIADSSGKRSARALYRLVSHPERFINPILVTITFCQTGQAFLTSLLADRLFGGTGVIIGFFLNVIFFFVLAEAMPKTWAVLSAERAALATARITEWVVSFPPLRAHLAGVDRAHQHPAPGQGSQGGAVRERAGAVGHRRGGGRGRGDRARGTPADREHHRVRRHRRPRGDGAAAGHGRRHRHVDGHPGARPRDRPRVQPAAGVGHQRRRHRRSRLHQGSDPRRARRSRR